MTHLCEEEAVEVEQGIGDDDVEETRDGDQTTTTTVPVTAGNTDKEDDLTAVNGTEYLLRGITTRWREVAMSEG